jgi:hypothetical protein
VSACGYYWFDPVSELQSIVEVGSAEYAYYQAWLQPTVAVQLLDLAVFCGQAQPDLPPLAISDFLDGSYIQKLVNFALAVVYADKCE